MHKIHPVGTMKTTFTHYFRGLLILLMAMLVTQGYSQFGISPGTVSYRLDDEGNDISDRLVMGRYYGYPTGTMTRNYDTRQFKEFSMFYDQSFPYTFEQLSHGDTLNEPWKFKNNFRLLYPVDFDSAAYYSEGQKQKYPLIIFMHGVGERANCRGNNCYGVDDPRYNNNDHSLVHGEDKFIPAVNRPPSDPRHWPGFVLVIQNLNGWKPSSNLNASSADTYRAAEFLKVLPDYYPIDINRIYANGLSNGAEAAWTLINGAPELIAALVAFSGHTGHTFLSGTDRPAFEESMIHIPVWQIQGGRDNKPSPSSTETKLNLLRNAGGTPRYTLYETAAHPTWNRGWNEPDFFSWLLQYSKLTIHSYYGVNEVCEGDDINVRLGISPNFDDYQWGYINSANDTTLVDGIVGKPNELIADQVGSYIVKFARGTEWTQWSDPFTITIKSRSDASIVANGPTAFTGLDGSTTVELEATNKEGLYYEWFKDGVPFAEDSTLFSIDVSESGYYTAVIRDQGLCESFESNRVYVSNEPFAGTLPAAPSNLFADVNSPNSLLIYWQDESDSELGFEIYRSEDGVNYTWIHTTAQDVLMYVDTALNSNVTYYYKVRAYNANGASTASNTALATTTTDTEAPSTVQNFTFERFGYTEYRENITGDLADEHFEINLDKAVFSWSPASDNVGVTSYEVYFSNGTLAGTTADTEITIPGLTQDQVYSFYVVAKDAEGNTSSPGNNVSVRTQFDGLYFKLHTEGTWDFIRDYSTWPIEAFGNTSTFDLSIREEFTDDTDYFAFDFFGYLYIENAGDYTFYTSSDDGSRLWIGSDMVVDNDGQHGMQERSGTRTLSPGIYPITVNYFERTGGQGLNVRYSGPSISKTSIPTSALTTNPNPVPSNLPVAPTNLVATADGISFEVGLTWDYDPIDIVVLGSSTAEGFGLTGSEKSWVEKLDSALTAQGASYNLTNLAKGGFTTYHVREDGSPNGGISGAPDTQRNITHALTFNPDIIIVNLPSNNVARNIDVPTTISHYDELKSLAEANGAEIFFTTSQPRNFGSDQAKRDLLEQEAIAVRANFGQYVIDIYDSLTDFSNGKRIKAVFNLGDGTHLTELGHQYIFYEAWKQVSPHMPRMEVYSSLNGTDFDIVHTTNIGETSFSHQDLQPSTNYSFRVRATNIFGNSDFSNTSSATTIDDVIAPSVPQNLTVRAKTANKVALSWDPSTDNVGVLQYIITYDVSGGGAGSRSASSGSRVASTARTLSVAAQSNENGITIEGLQPETGYEFAVAAIDASANNSGNSAPIVAQTLSDSPLPVEFLGFSYEIENNEVILKWSTASEINNSHFTVERSEQIDALTAIGEVEGAGNSASLLNYTFRDENPGAVNYYRIKQTDFDGKFDYSEVIRVVVERDLFAELAVYPNPASPANINLKGFVPTDQSLIRINFIDLAGKSHVLLETDPNSLIEGINLDMSRQLRPGVYFVTISDGLNISQKKLIIEANAGKL